MSSAGSDGLVSGADVEIGLLVEDVRFAVSSTDGVEVAVSAETALDVAWGARFVGEIVGAATVGAGLKAEAIKTVWQLPACSCKILLAEKTQTGCLVAVS